MGDALVASVLSVGIGLWVWLYLRYGREPPVAPQPEYLEDPPYDWTPIQLARVWNSEGVEYKDFVATLLDMARRGVLSLMAEPVTVLAAEGIAGTTQEYEYSILRAAGSTGHLSEAERYLVEKVLCIKASGRWISYRDLLVEGARNWPELEARFGRWADLAEEEPLPMPLRDPLSARMSWRGMAIALSLMLVTYPLCSLKTAYAVLPFAAGAIMMMLSFTIERRNPNAALARAKWDAYRRHLLDHTTLANEPPHAVEVWGKQAVYAATLGVATKMVDAFEWSEKLYD